ncbi:NO-inducible flavohemoprotein [Paracoccus mutanolyticus]|uniref:hypothetical protein n=1 Tax=Paracoccus mutanolyticus TaxID=1499308 RepID=UPI001CB995BC|nr:hypothetical protein [Paracoccus mutanolyticus]
MLKVAAPAGEFFMDRLPQRPVVLLSGGVGLTPMVAMLEWLVGQGAEQPVHYIHGTHDRDTHAMRAHVRALAERGRDIHVTDFHQTPLADEVAGRDYDIAGLITDEWLLANTPAGTADYYICGPRPFLRAAVSALSLAGVPAARIHYEFFGPADELLAA